MPCFGRHFQSLQTAHDLLLLVLHPFFKVQSTLLSYSHFVRDQHLQHPILELNAWIGFGIALDRKIYSNISISKPTS